MAQGKTCRPVIGFSVIRRRRLRAGFENLVTQRARENATMSGRAMGSKGLRKTAVSNIQHGDGGLLACALHV
jgi:hypothetical protein